MVLRERAREGVKDGRREKCGGYVNNYVTVETAKVRKSGNSVRSIVVVRKYTSSVTLASLFGLAK